MQITSGLAKGQVLQRLERNAADAVIAGTTTGRGTVRATVAAKGRALKGWKDRPVGAARRGKFTARLEGIPAGGPYAITLSVDADKATVSPVYVGDVWILAGQSNMQGIGNLSGAPKPHPLVHAFYMDRQWGIAREPIHLLDESPDPVHTAAQVPRDRRAQYRRKLKKGVGCGVFFGIEMVKRTGVPQGLICTAHGGTSMAQWDPKKRNEGGASLYGSMYLSWKTTGQPVSGVLWYQGESDANPDAAKVYTEKMKGFVRALRRDLRQPGLPFLMVQIGRFHSVNADEENWSRIRNEEVRLEKHIPNLACVSAIDLSMDDPIHVGSEGHARLGVRLARLADRLAKGSRKELPPPAFVSARQLPPVGGFGGAYHLEVTCTNVVGGLRASGAPCGFSLIDSNGADANTVYKVTLAGSKIRIETGLEENNGQFRLAYGHSLAPLCNITDGRDMPLPAFEPIPTGNAIALSPFVRTWLVSEVQPAPAGIADVALPHDRESLGLALRTFPDGFVNLHPEWMKRSGQAFLFSKVMLDEDMRLNMRIGYDGPIRLWIDGKEFLTDPNGTNPALRDAVIKPLALARGEHEIAVAMNLNGGLAWGLFLRFDRQGLRRKQIEDGAYKLPVCSMA